MGAVGALQWDVAQSNASLQKELSTRSCHWLPPPIMFRSGTEFGVRAWRAQMAGPTGGESPGWRWIEAWQLMAALVAGRTCRQRTRHQRRCVRVGGEELLTVEPVEEE